MISVIRSTTPPSPNDVILMDLSTRTIPCSLNDIILMGNITSTEMRPITLRIIVRAQAQLFPLHNRALGTLILNDPLTSNGVIEE